jgi:RNA polymerase sigma-70 factor, ECF subfamily
MSSTALTALYDAHAERVWAILHRLGVRPEDIPDLLQEVFLVVHRRHDELGDRPLAPFLWGVAAGLVRNHRRKAHRRYEIQGDGAEHASPGDPERALIDARRRRALGDALGALDPEKRAVFVMFELEGLSGQAIAAEVGVPIGTVHSRLHHARAALRAALTASLGDDAHERTGSEP